MNRFWAVRFGSTGIPDPEGRYRLVIGVRGEPHAPDCLRLAQQAVQDADDPPGRWSLGWGEFVAAHNLWMRDSRGNRFPGWGRRPGRYVVDLSLPAPWERVIADMLAASKPTYDGIQLDDAKEILFLGFGVPVGCWDPRKWRENVRRIVAAGAGPKNAMSGWWEYGYTRPESFAGYGYTKMEGFRFAPRFWIPGWGGMAEHPKTWETWWQGDPQHLGILGLEELGVTPLIEAQYEPSWDLETYKEYALVAVVTACLADKALLAFHPNHDWGTVTWTSAHDMAWRLGEPTAPARLRRTGAWARQFEHGHVVMNPTDDYVPEAPAHSARIYLKETGDA